MNDEMLRISELYASIQGESTFAGVPCFFVRLAGCNLRCSYCDTRHARRGGTMRRAGDIVRAAVSSGCPVVEVTGGEPLLQPGTPRLCGELKSRGLTVLVETNGSRDIGALPRGIVRIVDVKCPGSGMDGSFLASNLDALRRGDQVKFVLTGRADYEWARRFIGRHRLAARCTVILSPVWRRLKPSTLASWMLRDRLAVRMGIQLHKVIWGDRVHHV